MVRRVAKDLIANDETEISEVVRRRLFQDLGSEKIRKNVSKAFGDWCFERRAQLPPEWSAVDSATESKAREFLQRRFESCYPFHPASLSVFQRKWQALPQYQQTRGTLAMLAQWISIASQEMFRKARTEPLITLGSAPLGEPGFRSVVLGQLGESRLVAAIDAVLPANTRIQRPSMRTRRDRSAISTVESQLRSCSNRPEDKRIRLRIFRNCALPLASLMWIPRRSILPH